MKDTTKNSTYSPEEIHMHPVKKRRAASGDLRNAAKVLQNQEEEDHLREEEEEIPRDDGNEDDDEEADAKYCRRGFGHGYHLVKGQMGHGMEDYIVADTKTVKGHKLGLYAIFDGHSGRNPDFWKKPKKAIKRAYKLTDDYILSSVVGSRGGSTAVTAIVVDGKKLVVANVGDSRAILCRRGDVVKQLTVDHEPEKERDLVERKGGFISTKPGNVPRVDGQLAMTRAFGDGRLKEHISVRPDIEIVQIHGDTMFLILASDGLWKVMSNEEAWDEIKEVRNSEKAAKALVDEALARGSKDDISCVVVRFN
ncbi:hypothetical protein IGI04_010372 [Brassica rapa subsp. trilocularis]|uniref:PPM-type phosphatase domain-containing protein n=1 Tax=Brassica rapa subsp. trilocularis TaxID=1813537 RepID=A0ABQ7N000_BRACM|nr:hypothetical protein IGI04_010372 [Brassica rapa subsp. trilocularis]